MNSQKGIIAGCMKWGQWGEKFDPSRYRLLIEQCLENNISWFDHADIYGDYSTEAEFGSALKESPSLRGKIKIITKCGIRRQTPARPGHRIHSYDTSPEHIRSSAEASLNNFNTDYLDVLMIHRPDPLMHPDEIAEVISSLKKEGKIIQFGISNFSPIQAEMILKYIPVEYHQMEISVLKLDPFHDGSLDICLKYGIIPMAWGPLGSGKFKQEPDNEQYRKIIAVAGMLAEKYNAEPEQILLAFLFKHPSGIIPVVGSTKPERLTKANEAAKINIEREEWFMLWRASTGHEVP